MTSPEILWPVCTGTLAVLWIRELYVHRRTTRALLYAMILEQEQRCLRQKAERALALASTRTSDAPGLNEVQIMFQVHGDSRGRTVTSRDSYDR